MLVQRVLEGITRIEAAVGQLDDAEVIQPVLALHELVAALDHPLRVLAQQGGHRAGAELHAVHAGRFEHALRIAGQPPDLLLDDASQAVGYRQRQRGGFSAPTRPAPGSPAACASRESVTLATNKRQAARMRVQPSHEGFRQRRVRQATAQIVPDFALGEGIEQDFVAQPVQP